MSDLGFGWGSMGSCTVGYGEIVFVNSTVQKLFRLPEDITKRGNAVALNTVTGDVIRDPETGIHMGMIDTHQMVYLAIRTLKYSSSVADFGLDFNSDIIQPSTVQKLQDAVTQTLSSLVDQGKIEIISIIVDRINTNGLSCWVRWKDVFTNKKTTFKFTL